MEPRLHLTYAGTLEQTSPDWFLLLIPSSLFAGLSGKALLSGTLNGQAFEGLAMPTPAGYTLSLSRSFCERLGMAEGGPVTLDCELQSPMAEQQQILAPESAALQAVAPEAREAYLKLVADQKAELPEELRGWNWGAFLLGPIWGAFHGVWIGLLLFVPYVGVIASIPLATMFGKRGNEWAWKNRHWESVEQFRAAQRAWALWGILGSVALTVVVFAIAYKFYAGLYSGDLSGLDQLNGGNLNGVDLNSLQGVLQ